MTEAEAAAVAHQEQHEPQEWPDNRPLEKVCEPDEKDVLFSAENCALLPAADHEGNQHFLHLISLHQDDYQLKSQLERPVVALDILQTWRNKGGRFLRFHNKTRLWNDIGDVKARKKIVQALKSSNDEQRATSNGSEESTTEPMKQPQVSLRRISTKLNYAREGKLYGRKEQQEELVGIYQDLKNDASSTPREFVLISGESGIGKTALAHSLKSIVERDGGFFVEAKFDQQSIESTAALVMALSDFCTQLLERDEDTIERYREIIQKTVDEEARSLTSLIPELATIMGSEYQNPSVQGGQGSQATKRISYVFQSFLQAISSSEHPLVILLDNLHWANKSSLDVLAALVSSVDGVLFVGTYRDDDLTDTLALDRMVEQLDASLVNVRRIQLSNLDEEAVRFMLADALFLDSEQLLTIGHVVYSMTKGNVFFIMELLRSLQDEELLQFDETTLQWTCDSHLIQNFDAKSVNDLFMSKINDLPKEVQDTLKIASCFGFQLDLYLLQLLVGANVASYLNEAVAKGLLVVSGESGETFAFAHDGIQQATYNSIGSGEKESFHFKIGQKLLRKLEEEALEKNIFVVAGQLMLGDRLAREQEERAVLASVYLRAGEKAVELSNFESAAVYLRHGVDLIGDNLWKAEYHLSLRIHNAAAEVMYCTAQFDDVENMVNAILLNARCFEDTLHARATQIYTLGSWNRQPEAIEIGLETLKGLGEELPSYPSMTQLKFSMWRVKRLLRGSSNAALMRLPVMKVSRKVSAMQMLNLIWLSCLYTNPLLAAMVAVRMVKLTVTYGKCAVSCVGFGFYAMLMCGGGSNIDEGYRYGKLSMQMYDEFKNEAWLCRVSAAFHGCVRTWKEPVSVTIAPLDHAYRVGVTTGDIEYAVLCASMNCWNNSGRMTLPQLEKEIRSLAERIEFLGQATAFFFLKPLWQMTHNFMGRAQSDPKVLTGEIMDQETLTAEAVVSSPGLIVWIRCYCMVLALFLGDYDRAEEYSSTSHEIYDQSYGAMDAATVLFFECMTLLAQAKRGKRGRVAAVRKRLQRLRLWAKHSPLNFLGKQYLVEAELAVVTGDTLAALSKYTSSIVLSREEGFLMQEAFANERAGKFYLEQEEKALALPFLREACRCYAVWGGHEKLRHLKDELVLLGIKTEDLSLAS